MRDEEGNWVMKYSHKTFSIIKSTQFLNAQHASGAVYQVGDQFTKTRYDRKTTTGRERPTHSPAKENELPGNEGKSPAPRRQKNNYGIFHPGQAYRDQTTPKPNQNHSPEKATPEGKKAPIFGVIGKGFEFAPTTRQQRLFTAWMKGQQARHSTPGKASSAVQNMLKKQRTTIHKRTVWCPFGKCYPQTQDPSNNIPRPVVAKDKQF